MLDAQTEGMIGYRLERELRNRLPAGKQVATLVTMTHVTADDAAFADPTKFVGPVYGRQQAHDLAVLACSRYFTSFAVTPAALEDWHRYNLPAFLERLRDRLGDGCQPGKHMARPRTQRDEAHADASTRC